MDKQKYIEDWIKKNDRQVSLSQNSEADFSGTLNDQSKDSDTKFIDLYQPVSITGVSGFFPKCRDVMSFWKALDQDISLISEIPIARFDWRDYYDPIKKKGKMRTKLGGFIPDIELFDSDLFNILPLEADEIDPRQRLLMMATWRCLEDAGIDPKNLDESNTGVFIGCESNEYDVLLKQAGITYRGLFNNADSMIANRISYFFGFSGPSEMVNTMCSGFAIALNRAIIAIRSGKIDRAIVGAANLMLLPDPFINLSNGDQLSSSQTVKSFGENGDGYIRAEGVGCILIEAKDIVEQEKRYSYATIKNIEVNYNGNTGMSIASPNIEAHKQLIKKCYQNLNIDPRHIEYIEAQGMGLPVADIAEWQAINDAVKELHIDKNLEYKEGKCKISTLKPMIGHMHSASSLGAVLKIIRSFQTNKIHKILNFTEQNSFCETQEMPCSLAKTTNDWESKEYARIASAHSYGSGGNNAHILLEEVKDSINKKNSVMNHPFNLKYYWFKSQNIKKKVLDKNVSEHPFLKNYAKIEEGVLASFVVSKEDFFIRDHGVNKKNIFPGMGYIEFVRATASRLLNNTLFEISRIAWKSPMYVTERLEVFIELKQMKDKYSFVVSSKNKLGEITEHSQGDIKILTDLNKTIQNKPIQNLINVSEKVLFDHQSFYRNLDNMGFNYGPSFSNVREIYRLDNDILARIKLDEAYFSTLTNFYFHPGMLDSALHGVQCFLIEKQEPLEALARFSEPSIPFYLGSIEIFKPLEKQCYALIKQVSSENDLVKKFTINIFNEAGECCVILNDYHMRLVTEKKEKDSLEKEGLHTLSASQIEADSGNFSQLSESQEDDLKKYVKKELSLILGTFLKREVTEVDLNKEVEALGFDSIFVVDFITELSTKFEIELEVVALFDVNTANQLIDYICEEYGDEIKFERETIISEDVEVSTNRIIQESKLDFKEDSEEEVQNHQIGYFKPNYEFTKVIEDYIINDISEVSLVLPQEYKNYKTFFNVKEVYELPKKGQIQEDVLEQFLVLKEFILSKIRKKNMSYVLILMPKSFELEYGYIEALFKSVILDSKKIKYSLIWGPNLSNENEDKWLQIINNELNPVVIDNKTILYSDKFERQVKGLTQIAINNQESNLIRPNGVYWLIGALGGIGKLLYEAFNKPGICLIVSGRSELSSENKIFLDSMSEKYQFSVEYLQMDLSNESDVKRVYETIKDRYKNINGVINMAGYFKPDMISKKTKEDHQATFLSKINGTLNIDNITKNEALDFMLWFSSSTVEGINNHWDYALANQFQNNLAIKREKMFMDKKRFGKTISVCWPNWLNGGMFMDEKTRQDIFNKTGILSLEDQEGVMAFKQILNEETPSVVFVFSATQSALQQLNEIKSQKNSELISEINDITLKRHQNTKDNTEQRLQTTVFSKKAELFMTHFNLDYPYVTGAMGSFTTPLYVNAVNNAKCLPIVGTFRMTSEEVSNRLKQLKHQTFILNYVSDILVPTKLSLSAFMSLIKQYNLKSIEISGLLDMDLELAAFRVNGLYLDENGVIKNKHNLFVKVTRLNLAKRFFDPISIKLKDRLLKKGLITKQQYELVKDYEVSFASSLTYVRHGGGWLDDSSSIMGFRKLVQIKDAAEKKFTEPLFVGLTGEIALPEHFVSAFNEGADYVMPGSIHHLTHECGQSDKVKDWLESITFNDSRYHVEDFSGTKFQLACEKEFLQNHSFLKKLYENKSGINELTSKDKSQLLEFFGSMSEKELLDQVNIFKKEMLSKIISNKNLIQENQLFVIYLYYVHDYCWFNAPNENIQNNHFYTIVGESLGILNDSLKGSPLSSWRNRSIHSLIEFLMKQTVDLLVKKTNQHVTNLNQLNNLSLDKTTLKTDILKKNEFQEIAIIGIAGRYPQAQTLEQFWDNISQGKECISEVPKDHWALDGFYEKNIEQALKKEKSYSVKGGFMEGLYEFDPFFFNISPKHAEDMNPKARLFLQEAYHVIEDAGYTRKDLREQSNQNVGVFAGVSKVGYELYDDTFSAVANRVSYHFDFSGPSITVDTMCSSSLVAIHMACESLKRGECQVAIAGGVNAYLHKSQFIVFSKNLMLSKTGQTSAFGSDADGMVPGEGVGVVLLKPLEQAIIDQDNIYGCIVGSSTNHSGKSNGYWVPNSKSQSLLINKAFENCKLEPSKISYIEAHGTGTDLGDPIEFKGLKKVFSNQSKNSSPIYLGSLKTNIGHLEAAAGVASLTKICLQLKHKKICPSLNSSKLNEKINFSNSSIIINQSLRDWEQLNDGDQVIPRYAGVSSFGAGGTNAHLILKEFEQNMLPVNLLKMKVFLVVFSAKNETQLDVLIQETRIYLENNQFSDDDLINIAYTLQIGREAKEERVGFIINSLDDLNEKLSLFLDKKGSFYRGNSQDFKKGLEMPEDVLKQSIENWIETNNFKYLLDAWSKGVEIPWKNLYDPNNLPRRISLNGYPFEKNTYRLQGLAEAELGLSSFNDTFKLKFDKQKEIVDKVEQKLESWLVANETSLNKPEYSVAMNVEKIFLDLLKMEKDKFDDKQSFEMLGVDSVLMVRFVQELNAFFKLDMAPNEFNDISNLQDVFELVKSFLKKMNLEFID